jgi:hypothetical protein
LHYISNELSPNHIYTTNEGDWIGRGKTTLINLRLGRPPITYGKRRKEKKLRCFPLGFKWNSPAPIPIPIAITVT